MSDTPRTAAKYAEIFAEDDYEAVEKLNELAQQLERELNEAKERIKMLEEAGDRLASATDMEWLVEADIEARIYDWWKAKEAKP